MTYGTRTSCTLLMTCLPTMMTRSSCANSMRHPPAAHCNSTTSGELGARTRHTHSSSFLFYLKGGFCTPTSHRTCLEYLENCRGRTFPPHFSSVREQPLGSCSLVPHSSSANCSHRLQGRPKMWSVNNQTPPQELLGMHAAPGSLSHIGESSSPGGKTLRIQTGGGQHLGPAIFEPQSLE